CGDYKLSDKEMYLGLERDKALECFDMDKKYPAPLTPKPISEADGIKYEAVIDESITKSFAVRTVTLNGGSFALSRGAAVYMVTEGEGNIVGGDESVSIRKGDYFLLPEAAKNRFSVIGKNLKLTECFV
ncbi:MAG: mannose-6-phosphate isomerase, partial [Clostridia bacterium]|nr:mannose-6-phosphate isomerase [Clostridia bacterium]